MKQSDERTEKHAPDKHLERPAVQIAAKPFAARVVSTNAKRTADPPGLAALVEWFMSVAERLPREPFRLTPGKKVVEPEKAYAAWRIDIASSSPVRKQVLLQELQELRVFMERSGSSSSDTQLVEETTLSTPVQPLRLITTRARIITPEQHRREQQRMNVGERLRRGPPQYRRS